MLLIGVLAVTDGRNMQPIKGFQPFAIGLIVFVIGMTYHLNCGYAINPARDLGPRIYITTSKKSQFTVEERVLILFRPNIN
jgi:glycerol uptake facilitator-like aquaporin